MVVIDGQQRITTTCILLIELKRAINNFIASKSRQNCQKLDLLTKAKEDIDSVLFMQKGPMLNMQTLEEGDDIKVRGVGQRGAHGTCTLAFSKHEVCFEKKPQGCHQLYLAVSWDCHVSLEQV